MTRSYQTVGPDGVASLTPPISDYVNAYSLAASTAETVTWPSWATHCNIVGVSGVDYYVRTGGTATVPSSDTTDGTASARNVAQRQRGQGEASFSIISASATVVTIEFWGGNYA